MEIRTSDLIGQPLNWAVAHGLGISVRVDTTNGACFASVRDAHKYGSWRLAFSSDWAQGGPVLALHNISIDNRKDEPCLAFMGTPAVYLYRQWATEGEPLVAAMRCYVAAVLGQHVEVPDLIMNL
jgi:hypothetical protein